MKDLMKDLIIATTIAVLFCIFCIFVVYSAFQLAKFKCVKLGEQIEMVTEYNLFGTGCAIEIDGKLIPKSKWIYNNGN